MKPGHQQAGYSSGAYLLDKEYAKNAEHYVRAFTLIQEDLQEIFEYVEPSEECRKSYSYRIHALFMRTCIEIEANLKAILQENRYTKKSPNDFTMSDYRKVNVTHHLSSYEVLLPIWSPTPPILKPFEAWDGGRGLKWYQDYNKSKHDRHEQFKRANLENLVMSVAGLLIIVSSQFKDQEFSPAAVTVSFTGFEYHPLSAAIGELFRIKFPEDWTDGELYEFDWTVLKTRPDRFEKIDYDAIA